jgi:hypothetical protein
MLPRSSRLATGTSVNGFVLVEKKVEKKKSNLKKKSESIHVI